MELYVYLFSILNVSTEGVIIISYYNIAVLQLWSQVRG